jgi:hypothetical protein
MFLRHIDLFGVPIQLYFKKELKSKSNFGGVVTLFLTGFFIYIFYYFSSDLLYRTNPSVRSTEIYIQDSNVSLSDLFTAFDFFNNLLQPIPEIERYIHIEGQVWGTKLNDKGEKTYDFLALNSTKCDAKKHFKGINETSSLPISQLSCIKFPQDSLIRNGFLETPGIFFTLVVFKCYNSTANNSKLY